MVGSIISWLRSDDHSPEPAPDKWTISHLNIDPLIETSDNETTEVEITWYIDEVNFVLVLLKHKELEITIFVISISMSDWSHKYIYFGSFIFWKLY